MAGKQMVSTNNPPLNSNLFDFRFIAGCLLISWLLHCRIYSRFKSLRVVLFWFVQSSYYEPSRDGSKISSHNAAVTKNRLCDPRWAISKMADRSQSINDQDKEWWPQSAFTRLLAEPCLDNMIRLLEEKQDGRSLVGILSQWYTIDKTDSALLASRWSKQ